MIELLPFFIDCAVRASVFLGFAWAVTAMMRRASASTRHFLWACAIAAAALVPVTMTTLPRWRLPSPAALAPPAFAIAPWAQDGLASDPQNAPPTRTPTSHATTSDRDVASSDPSAAIPFRGLSSVGIAASVWAAGTTGMCLYLLAGFLSAWRLRRSATRVDPPWVDQAQALARSLGMHRPIAFGESATASMPLACGVWRPAIVLPDGAQQWPEERLRIVVLHELAHIKRYDSLTLVLAQGICAVYWFNPLVWVAARCLCAERERACDDVVLATGTKGSDYAGHLVEFARAMQARWLPVPAGLSMAHRSQLEKRLIAILDPRMRRSSTRHARLGALAIVLLMSIPISAVQLTAMAPVSSRVTIVSNSHRSSFPAIRPIEVPRVIAISERDGDRHASGTGPAPPESRDRAARRERQTNEFQWSGNLAQGETLEVRGLSGSIRTITSTSGGIRVDARISNPARVRVDVLKREAGMTICTVMSTPQGDESECQPGRRAGSAQRDEGGVDFVVRVPAGVRFAGSMVHGDIEVDDVRSDVNVATINGDIALKLSHGHGAEFHGNLISGTIESDFPVHDSTPPLPSGGRAGGSGGPRIVHATIGNGGPALRVASITGNIRLWQR